jgi:hypothetical protein
MTDDIVARLRLRTDPSQMLMCYPPRPAPDMLCCEAAAEIERLRAEDKRLRAALREIAKYDTDVDGNWGFFRDEADAALGEKKDD